MPNQYTKASRARETAQPIQFRFREYGKPTRLNRSGQQQQTSRIRGKCFCQKKCRCNSKESLSIYSPSSGLRNDPFDSHGVKPDKSELAVLDHFFHILIPAEPLSTTRRGHIDPHINLLLPQAMNEPAVFDALLASCRASIALSSGLSVLHDEFLVTHRGRALNYLRKKVTTGIDKNSMLVVSMLLICDHLIGDADAVTNHATALARMSEIHGQNLVHTPLDRFVRSGAMAFQSIRSIVTGHTIPYEGQKKTRLDELVDSSFKLVYLRPPFTPAVSEKWCSMPEGFCDLVLSCQISTQLCIILEEVAELKNKRVETLQEHVGATRCIQAAIQRFSQHTAATYLERCIAAGLWCWTVQYPRIQVPNLFHDPIMNGFSRLFMVSFQPASDAERNATVWSHMSMQGFASLRATTLPGSRDAFRGAIDRFDVMKDWSNLKPVLTRFFHTSGSLKRWEWTYESFKAYSGLSNSCPHPLPSMKEDESSFSSTSSRGSPASICPVFGFERL